MKQLTEKQRATLAYIKTYQTANGYPPSVREVGDSFKITVKAAYDRIFALRKKGYIENVINTARGMKIIQQESSHESC